MLTLGCVLSVACVVACGPGKRPGDDFGDDATSHGDGVDPGCPLGCSADLHSVVDCNNTIVTTCSATDACDGASHTCVDACQGAATNHHSVGCDYYATDTETEQPTYCFAAFVANTWTSPAHISVEYGGTAQTVATFTKLPVGNGPSLTYTAYDPVAGLPPGQVAILFLAGASGGAPNCPLTCPVTSAVPNAAHNGTGIFTSFHITTDVPVVAYEINPYGGGSVAVTAASLLLPTSVWDVDYVAVNPVGQAAGSPSLNIVARGDGTQVTFTPVAAVSGGGGVPAGAANTPMTINLSKGQHAQITQPAELTGSIISSNVPVGLMGAHNCMNMPVGTSYCDHGEQMVPPVHALGFRYVGVMYRPRIAAETSTFWRVIGAVDGTHADLLVARRRAGDAQQGPVGHVPDRHAVRRHEPGRGSSVRVLHVHDELELRHRRLRRSRLRRRRAARAVPLRLRVLRRSDVSGDQPRRDPREGHRRRSSTTSPSTASGRSRTGSRSATTSGRAPIS